MLPAEHQLKERNLIYQEEFVKYVSHHTIRCNWSYFHCSILLQISLYIYTRKWVVVCMNMCVSAQRQHAARFFYTLNLNPSNSLRWQWTSSRAVRYDVIYHVTREKRYILCSVIYLIVLQITLFIEIFFDIWKTLYFSSTRHRCRQEICRKTR